jgi:hypothetical protein
MASKCFDPFGPSSGSIQRNLAKVTAFVEIISKNMSLKLLICCGNICFSLYSCVYWVLCGVSRRTAPSTHTAVQTEAHIATAHQQF